MALLTDGFGGRGGIARYNQDLMTALSQSSAVSAISILPRFGDTRAALPAGVRQYGAVGGKFAWTRRALEIALCHPCDVIFCGHLNAAPLAAAIARLARKPYWLQVHGIEAWQPQGAAKRWAVDRATLVTSVSRYTRTRLLDWSDIAPERVRVLPNTVSADFTPRPRRQDLIERYGLAGKRVITTVGRLDALEQYKGHDRIIAAMPDVLQQVPDAVYLIVGSGDDQLRLQALADQAGVRDRVTFAGQIPGDELADHVALSDVFAMPSTGEGFGIAFLEAAAMGVPVIGGNRDGSADALADGAIGQMINPDDPAELKDAICAHLLRPTPAGHDRIARFTQSHFVDHVGRLVCTLHDPPLARTVRPRSANLTGTNSERAQ
ncbi:MAG: glycosyltransferase family 4 protein [Pseudomonadota bacterium]